MDTGYDRGIGREKYAEGERKGENGERERERERERDEKGTD